MNSFTLWQRKRCFRGQSLIARLLDLILCCAIVFFGVLVLTNKRTVSYAVACAASILCLVLILLRRSKRFESFRKGEEKRVKNELAAETLLMMNHDRLTDELKQRIGQKAELILRWDDVQADDLFHVLRDCGSDIEVYASADFSKDAAAIASRLNLKLHTREELNSIIRLPAPTELEIQTRLEDEYARSKGVSLRQRLLMSPGEGRLRYFLLGAMLLLSSFISSYPLYCRMLAALSFALYSVFSILAIRQKAQQQ